MRERCRRGRVCKSSGRRRGRGSPCGGASRCLRSGLGFARHELGRLLAVGFQPRRSELRPRLASRRRALHRRGQERDPTQPRTTASPRAGQVLRYRHLLAQRTGGKVRAVLVPEREPDDDTWTTTAADVDVVLLPAPRIEAELERLLSRQPGPPSRRSSESASERTARDQGFRWPLMGASGRLTKGSNAPTSHGFRLQIASFCLPERKTGDPGIEPGVAVLETAVLPIHQSPGRGAHCRRRGAGSAPGAPARRGSAGGGIRTPSGLYLATGS
jgi:hypothetical protein